MNNELIAHADDIEESNSSHNCDFADFDDDVNYGHVDISKMSRDFRKAFKIPKRFDKVYLVESSSFTTILSKLPEAKKHLEFLDYNSGRLEEEGFSGVFRNKDFIVVSKLMWSGKTNLIHIIFTDDLVKIKSFFKKESEFTNGIYEIGRGLFGEAVLCPIEMKNVSVPILNDKLFEKMKREIDMFIKKEDFYKDNNIPYKRGILLYGSPGNGKTTFIKHLLSKIDAWSVITDSKNSSHIEYVRDMLRNEKLNNMLKIIVMEDVDGMDSYIRSSFLNMLDGILCTNKTIFIATTNFPHMLDIGIKNRPSRFDSFYEIDDPNDESRRMLIKSFFPGIEDDVLAEAVERTKSFKGAHFKEIYILSQLGELDILTAIEQLKDKFKNFMNYDKGKMSYIG